MTSSTCLQPTRKGPLRLPLLSTVLALAIVSPAVAENPRIRHFRLGPLIGMNIDAEFDTSGIFTAGGSDPGPAGVPGVNHVYDDGFVRVDDTGNASGLTSFWGYDNASQYDANANTLTFRGSSAYATTGSSSAEDSPYLGVDLAYGGTITRWRRTFVSWELGLSFLPIDIKASDSLPGIFRRAVHQFDTGGIVMPSAPYAGDSSGTGPLISDTATALPDEITPGTVSGSRSLEVMLYNLRLGPHFHWDIGRRFGLEAGLGFALGVVNGRLASNETLLFPDGSTSSNSSSFWDTSMVYGGYVNGIFLFNLEKNADLFIAGQYMSLGNADFSSGGRSAELKLNQGLYFSFGFNWYF